MASDLRDFLNSGAGKALSVGILIVGVAAAFLLVRKSFSADDADGSGWCAAADGYYQGCEQQRAHWSRGELGFEQHGSALG